MENNFKVLNKELNEVAVKSELPDAYNKNIIEQAMNERIENVDKYLSNKEKCLDNLDNTSPFLIQSYDLSSVFNSSQTKLVTDMCINRSEYNPKSVLKSLKKSFKKRCNIFVGSSKTFPANSYENYGFYDENRFELNIAKYHEQYVSLDRSQQQDDHFQRRDNCVNQIPIIEIYDKSSKTNKDMTTLNNPIYQKYIGALKVFIKLIGKSELMVSITDCRDVQNGYNTTQVNDIFTELSIGGNDGKRQTKKHFFLFNKSEKSTISSFTFKIQPGDIEKRIIISMILQQNVKEYTTIGTMSFGILNILKNNSMINGWYYLLQKDLGHVKHMKVLQHNITNGKPCSGERLKKKTKMSSVNANLEKLEHYHIILRKSHKQGYGFAISNGPFASVISSIKTETPADNSGLQVGDWIIGINGQSVGKTCADSIGQIIKHFPRCVVLDLIRPEYEKSMSSSYKNTRI